MYCVICGSKAKPNWVVNYYKGSFGLSCNRCYEKYHCIKILTYDEFMQDQYLTELICGNKFIYYTNGNSILKYSYLL